MSVNKVILLGNVGKDPDVRYPAQGQIVPSGPIPLPAGSKCPSAPSGTAS